KGTVVIQLANTSGALYSGTVFDTITALPATATDTSVFLALGQTHKKLKLKPDQSVTLKAKVTVPIPTPAEGDYLVVSTVTGTGTDPAGIATSSATPIDVENPRVTLQDTTPPTALALAFGKKIALALPVTNAGNVAAKGKVSVSVFISADGSVPDGAQ